MLNGVHWIAGESVSGDRLFHANNPVTGERLEPGFPEATTGQIDSAVAAAVAVHESRALFPAEARIRLLKAMARKLEEALPRILERGVLETGLPAGRFEAEMGRTCSQLLQFAETVSTGLFREPVMQSADLQREPLPRPDLRRRMIPLGPVAVFGASNFPLAFGVAGGDTASAFAAGCPVIVKGHPAHPGVCELVGEAITSAVEEAGLPSGTFSLIHGESFDVGVGLTAHAGISAVGFTGSQAGGLSLWRIAAQREVPIPVFAEMGSANPVFVFPEAINERGEEIAAGLAASVLLGVGQFCTCPGILILVRDENSEAFKASLSRELFQGPAGTMLHQGIHAGYQKGLQEVAERNGVELVGKGPTSSGSCDAEAGLLAADARRFIDDPVLQAEIFGPSTLLVECDDLEQLLQVASVLEGQLTATIHATENELADHPQLLARLEDRVGRLIFNGFPTGVEVGESMHHGGPWPATTDSRWTSVGMSALERFQRPVCWQGFPESLLPGDLSADSGSGTPFRLDGEWHGRPSS